MESPETGRQNYAFATSSGARDRTSRDRNEDQCFALAEWCGVSGSDGVHSRIRQWPACTRSGLVENVCAQPALLFGAELVIANAFVRHAYVVIVSGREHFARQARTD